MANIYLFLSPGEAHNPALDEGALASSAHHGVGSPVYEPGVRMGMYKQSVRHGRGRRAIDLASALNDQGSGAGDNALDDYNDEDDDFGEYVYQNKKSAWYSARSSFEAFPSACFLDAAARLCTSKAAANAGGFCHWFVGCAALQDECPKYLSDCRSGDSGTKTSERHQRIPGIPARNKSSAKCCACGVSQAQNVYREAADVAAMCPHGYAPDEVSLFDLIDLLFQTKVIQTMKGCDTDTNGCLDTYSELQCVAALREKGPLALSPSAIAAPISKLISRLYSGRDNAEESRLRSLSALDVDKNGCVDDTEALLSRLSLGECYIGLASDGTSWSADALPKSYANRFRIVLGNFSKVHCEEVLGARWSETPRGAPRPTCATSRVQPRGVVRAVETLCSDVQKQTQKNGGDTANNPLLHQDMSQFHSALASRYDVQSLTPRFRVPSPFKRPGKCIYREKRGNGVAVSAPAAPIPKIIHQSWKSRRKIPDFAVEWLSTWPRLNPQHTYVFWDDADNRALVSKYFPFFEPAYDAMKPVERADFARYGYLYLFGGIYADMDSACVKSFQPLHKMPGFLGEEPTFHAKLLEHRDEKFASNALMGSVKGHPFWIFLMTAIAVGGTSGDPVTNTGPRRISQLHGNFFKNGTGSANFGEIRVLSEEYFMPEPAWWNVNAMRETCDDEAENDAATRRICEDMETAFEHKDEKDRKWDPNTYSVHNWRCTWCRGTGTEVFVNLTDDVTVKNACRRPRITENATKWIPCGRA